MTIDRRRVVGWTAVGISTLFSTLWAFWGAIEAFHEGWYERSWGATLGPCAAPGFGGIRDLAL